MEECVVCGEHVNVHRRGWYRQVLGWEETRKAGGANKITRREVTGQVMHYACMTKLEQVQGQEQMFE